MDQQKIGQFIAEMRKEQGLTQRALAEKLLISDKTVSKWECGNGMPEVSLMMPLCEILQISVNELLTGKRLQSSEYKQNAEENIMRLMNERKIAKRSLWVGIVAMLSAMLPAFTLIYLAGLLEMEDWIRVLMIVIGFVALIGGLIAAIALEVTSGAFECAKCGKRFMPTTAAYLWGVHTATRRWLKCPHCGKKSMAIRRFSLEAESGEDNDS